MSNLEQLDLFERKPFYQLRAKDFLPCVGLDNYKLRNRDNPDRRVERGLEILVAYNLSLPIIITTSALLSAVYLAS